MLQFIGTHIKWYVFALRNTRNRYVIGLATNDVTNAVTCSEMPALRQTRYLDLAFKHGYHAVFKYMYISFAFNLSTFCHIVCFYSQK